MMWGGRGSVLHVCAGEILYIQVRYGESMHSSIKYYTFPEVIYRRNQFFAMHPYYPVFLAGLFLCKYKCMHLLKVVCQIIPTGSGGMNPICRWIHPNYMWKWPCMTWDVQMALTVEVKALHWSGSVIIQSNPQMSGCQSQNLIILTDMSRYELISLLHDFSPI